MLSVPRIAGKFARYVAPENFSHPGYINQANKNAKHFVDDLASVGAYSSTWDAAARADKPFVNLYQTSLFRPINTYLRQGDDGLITLQKATGTRAERIYPETRLDVARRAINIIPDIEEELLDLPKYQDNWGNWVGRGIPVRGGGEWLDKMGYRKGAIVTDPSFVSTSTNMDMARKFAYQNFPSKETIADAIDDYNRYYKANVWSGKPIKSAPDFSPVMMHIQSKNGRVAPTGLINQNEVIFRPNTQFEVLDVTRPADYPGLDHWSAYLREI